MDNNLGQTTSIWMATTEVPQASPLSKDMHMVPWKSSKGLRYATRRKIQYTDKQKRQAELIEEGYEERGVPEKEAERRAWATVNKMTGGGKKSGSGRGQPVNKKPARKGGRKWQPAGR